LAARLFLPTGHPHGCTRDPQQPSTEHPVHWHAMMNAHCDKDFG